MVELTFFFFFDSVYCLLMKASLPASSTGMMSANKSMNWGYGGNKPPDSSANSGRTPVHGQQSSLNVPDGGGDWTIPSAARFEYNRMFSNADRFHRGYLTGAEVRPLLLRSGLAQMQLAQIWSLVVSDSNSSMKCEEFVIAMHLASCVAKGKQLPSTLPSELSKLKKSSTPGISRAGKGGVSVTKSAFAEKCESSMCTTVSMLGLDFNKLAILEHVCLPVCLLQ